MSTARNVTLVVHRRIRDEGFGAFSEWQARVHERLRSWPGFLGQEVVPPSPPAHVDWTIVHHFASVEAARGWLASEERARLLDEISRYFVGQEDVHLLPDAGSGPRISASAMISFVVPPGDEAEFLKWQDRLQVAQAKFPGFRRYKLERPVPGVHDDWLVVVNYDTEANLTAWLESAERRALHAEGGHLGRDISVRRSNYGFDFWFPAQEAAPRSRHGIFKSSLLILVVLYPLAFAWGHFISTPLIEAHDVPVWLSQFIGNFVSTQLLGWALAPMIFTLFRWWMPAGIGFGRHLAGYAATVALCGLALVACALLAA